jgi:hypothetical protein
MASVEYPVTAIIFDGVTLGAFGDLIPDMTLLLGTTDGADDLGRTRVQNFATSTSIPTGRISQGREDGTLDIQDNAYITVLDDYRIWAKIPHMSLDGEITTFKDSDIPILSYNTEIPPKANCGPFFADYIDDDTGLITVIFPLNGVNESYAVAAGATLTDYLWDVGDGTITVGDATSESITVTFPAGKRWVGLTVTDSNGKVQTSRTFVLAVDPEDDVTFKSWGDANISLEKQGEALDLEIFEDLPRGTYLDGCLVLLWEGAPTGPGDRSHMRFVGWLQSEDWNIQGKKEGFTRETTLRCLDVAGRLETLPGFPQGLERNDEVAWEHMPDLTISRVLNYLGAWHTTAWSVADVILPVDGDEYPAVGLDTNGSNIFDQLNSTAKKMVPAHLLTCTPAGRLIFQLDWMEVDIGDRPAASSIILESHYSQVRAQYNRNPKIHVLHAGAILASTAMVEMDGVDTIPLVFAKAPGVAFSQGTNEMTQSEGLARSQEELNIAAGHRYARLNARYEPLSIELANLDSFWDYVPAYMNRVQLNLAAAYAAQRGLDFTTEEGMVKSMTVRYNASNKGYSTDVSFTWERETDGYTGVTHIPEETEPNETEVPEPFEPVEIPLPGDEELYYGDIQGYVLWTSAHVFRTWDLRAGSPTWELIDDGITGTIYSGQYVPVDEETIGMWLMTSDGIWWCNDIMLDTPFWDEVLPIATVQAADAVPTTGVVQFKSMFPYWSEPGFLCVATGPEQGSSNNPNYQHCYFWHTHDYGATWTQIDANSILHSALGGTYVHGYYHASLFSMNIERASPGTIWCVRYTPNVTTVEVAVLKSVDGGHTWSLGAALADTNVSNNWNSLLNPFPDAGDPSYAVAGEDAAATGQVLEKSVDGWTSKTTLTAPTGYTGISSLWRVNKRTFDDLHIMAWWYHTAEAQYHLLETNDGGITWNLLWDSAMGQGNVSNLPMGTAQAANHNTPNGWSAAETLIPDEALPLWGTLYDGVTTTSDGPSISLHLEQVSGGGSGPSTSGQYYLLLAPPTNAVRVVVEGAWSETRILEDTGGGAGGGSFVGNISDGQPGNITDTIDTLTKSTGATNNGAALIQSFTIEWTRNVGQTDWELSKDDMIASPPTTHTSYCHIGVLATASATGDNIATEILEIAMSVVEVELEDGSIYQRGPGQWVLILANANGAPVTNLVQLTLDNFATLHDRTGNLIAIGGAWPDGANDGFALPKVGVNVDEPTPDELLPRWGEWDDDSSTFTLGALSNSASVSANISISGVSAIVGDANFLQLGPPANTKRMVVEGTWSQTVTRTGTPSTNVQNGIGKPISVSWTEDFTPDIHSNTAGTWSGSFTAEYEFAGADWPNNKDVLVSSPPTSGSGNIVYFWCDVSANSANAAYAATCMSSFTVTVTEIELDDGTIYTP